MHKINEAQLTTNVKEILKSQNVELIPYYHGKIEAKQLFDLIHKEERRRRISLWLEIVDSPPAFLPYTLRRIANDLAS